MKHIKGKFSVSLLLALCLIKLSQGKIVLKPLVDDATQKTAVEGLISRLFPNNVSDFLVEVNENLTENDLDVYQLETVCDNGDCKTKVMGSTGVAAASGLYYYMKYYCGMQVTWAGSQLALPSSWPKINPPVKVKTKNQLRYYANVCTESYSHAFWSYEDWMEHVDWLALRGINLPLAFTGQEYIWRETYRSLGLNDSDLSPYFGGPAFLAWSRMANMQGWGGPLRASWIDSQFELLKQILKRETSFGMVPVLSGFSGSVPDAITKIYPDIKLHRFAQGWGGFPEEYCCVPVVEFTDPHFQIIGQSFYRKQKELLGGQFTVFNTDQFNENIPWDNSEDFVRAASAAASLAMRAVIPDAVWLMQGWLFLSDPYYSTDSRTEAYLSSPPNDSLIILDLYADQLPDYDKTKNFFGRPWIWCLLHNFGGNNFVRGHLPYYNTAPHEAAAAPPSDGYPNNFIGMGLTPEGIYQNEVVYELVTDTMWQSEPFVLEDWIKNYWTQRYGGYQDSNTEKAWKILTSSVYNVSHSLGSDTNVYIRNLNLKSTVTDKYYNREDLVTAAGLLYMAHTSYRGQELFYYDLVDFTRQATMDSLETLFNPLLSAYQSGDKGEVEKIGSAILEGLRYVARAVDVRWFSLDVWLARAQKLGVTLSDKKWLNFNAKNQITIWGPAAEGFQDYACKEYSQMFQQYYIPRFEYLLYLMIHNETIDNQQFIHQSGEAAIKWNHLYQPITKKEKRVVDYQEEFEQDRLNQAVGFALEYAFQLIN